jgi:uncharacterized membrane protein YphA (DoxX/SURF4 family)
MRSNKLRAIFTTLLLFIVASPFTALAHEQYVLTASEMNHDLALRGPSVWSSLNNPTNLKIALMVGIGSLLVFLIYFFWERSKGDKKFEIFMDKLEPFGHVVLRIALAASLIFSADFSVFLGPELPLTTIPLGLVLKPVMYVLGGMLLIGLWSEIASVAAAAILILATLVYKDYMLSYANYLGEFIALIFFGSRVFSVDRMLYGVKSWAQKYQKYEIALIRITYGISIMYPAIIYKLLHPAVIVDIVNRYNLTQFHWLFPSDPLLISLGTGLAQVTVGICLILGFETRLMTFVTFVLMILSVSFFKEAVWPHYILLALSFYLMINNGGEWGLDYYVQRWRKRKATVVA